MENFHFDTQEPQELLRFQCVCGGFIGKSAVIKYYQLLSKAMSINLKSRFDQLATTSFYTLLKFLRDNSSKCTVFLLCQF